MRRALLVVAALAALVQGIDGQDAAAVLRGTVDIHVHSLPDSRPRSLHGIEAARQAKARGMRGLVLKNHYEWTSGLAYLARQEVPGIEVFGGVDLNLPVGGINPHAVEYMRQTSGGYGRIVWFPTFDAENAVRFDKAARSFVSVSRDGALLPAVTEVIALIAKHDLVLATGHSTAEEGLMLLREARRAGVRRMVVTHAMNPPILMTVPQMQEAAKLGAFVEFVGSTLRPADAPARLDRFAAAIRAVGPEFCILSSDLGQEGNELPVDGFAAFIQAMRARGFSAAELDAMTRRNPARLLRLE
jgi:hypothetical protein